MSTKISPELRAKRIAALEKARAILAEKRKAQAVMNSMPQMDLIEAARQLGQLYGLRAEVTMEIEALEKLLSSKSPSKQISRRSRRGTILQPSLDALSLFQEGKYYTREELYKQCKKAFGDRYGFEAFSSTLRRLEHKGFLRFDQGFWTRTKKAIR